MTTDATLSAQAVTGPDRFLRPGPIFAERGGRGGVLAGKAAPQSEEEEGEEIGGVRGKSHAAGQDHHACRHQRLRRVEPHVILPFACDDRSTRSAGSGSERTLRNRAKAAALEPVLRS